MSAATLSPEQHDALSADGYAPHEVQVLWSPHPGFQERALAATEDDLLIGGAAGGGKTDVLLVKFLHQAWHERARGLFLRASFPELRDVMDRAQRLLRPLGWVWSEQAKRWTAPSGATLEFGYCSSFADAQRYWGQEYTFIAFDEIGKLADEKAWDFVCSRLRVPTDIAFPQDLLQQLCSANPGGVGHGWLRARYVIPTQNGAVVYTLPNGKTRAFYPGRLRDNPSLGDDYRRQLENLPERLRRQLLDGDWDAGDGLALEELDERRHFVKPFAIPRPWSRWGAFDWGFRHPWCLVVIAESTDGERFVVECLHNRRQLPHEIAASIREYVDPATLQQLVAGHDAFHEKASMGDATPTVAETFLRYGLTLSPANIARVQGLNALRQDLAWRGIDRGQDGTPRLRFFDTPRVRWLFDQLQSLPTSEKNPEDAMKRDADGETGLGGDDGYDALRYAIATRIAIPIAVPVPDDLRAFSPEALRLEHERLRRNRHELHHHQTQPLNSTADRSWEIS